MIMISVLEGVDMADVQIANARDEAARTLDRLAMRPGFECGNEMTAFDVIRAKYGPEGDPWVRYWCLGRWERARLPVPKYYLEQWGIHCAVN